jgi:hypothetical protein
MTEYEIEVDDMGLGLMRSDPFYKSIEIIRQEATSTMQKRYLVKVIESEENAYYKLQ